jgi:hypothetical protein
MGHLSSRLALNGCFFSGSFLPPDDVERKRHGLAVMAGLVPPARPKPLWRGEGPAIHAFGDRVTDVRSYLGLRIAEGNSASQAR